VSNRGKKLNLGRTYKSIIFEILPQAIEAERAPSGRVDNRGLFYACRRLYRNHPERPRAREEYFAKKKGRTEDPISFSYFKNQILSDYQAEFGRIEGLDRKAMSDIYQSHTIYDAEWKKIATAFVENFVPPPYYFDKVMFVEKRGVAEDLAEARFGELCDTAIIAAPGFGSEADRNLLRLFAENGYAILVLHDLDINGIAILANIQDGNQRVGGVETEVIDLGLRLVDVPALDRQLLEAGYSTGFIGEDATRSKRLPTSILDYLTPEEHDMLTGKRLNQKTFEYHRYELNEIPADLHLAVVERKMEESGLTRKVIPPESYLGDTATRKRDSDIKLHAEEALLEVVGEAVNEAMVEKFKDRYDLDTLAESIPEDLETNPALSWRDAVETHVSEQGEQLVDEIEAAVREYLNLEDVDD
jgi:hypothetical protein